jgi:hypothetical protein
MLDAFRALGGSADNIVNGTSGFGLHAQDKSRPVSLSVPSNLCFALDDIEVVDGDMRLKDSANVGPGERAFFESYSRAFSWGAGAGADMERFIAALDALPSEARDLLENQLFMPNLFQGDPAERATQRYLWGRHFQWNNRGWFVPIAELARHGARTLSPALSASGTFRIQGTVPGEVLVYRGTYDTLGVFFTSGVVEPQDQAYSLAVSLSLGTTDVSILRDTARTVTQGGFSLPEVTHDQQTLTFSFLMIGNVRAPRLSRGAFLHLTRDTPITKPDETFDRVLIVNRRYLLELLGALEPLHGEAVIALRKATHMQLERISHCIGTRAL